MWFHIWKTYGLGTFSCIKYLIHLKLNFRLFDNLYNLSMVFVFSLDMMEKWARGGCEFLFQVYRRKKLSIVLFLICKDLTWFHCLHFKSFERLPLTSVKSSVILWKSFYCFRFQSLGAFQLFLFAGIHFPGLFSVTKRVSILTHLYFPMFSIYCDNMILFAVTNLD